MWKPYPTATPSRSFTKTSSLCVTATASTTSTGRGRPPPPARGTRPFTRTAWFGPSTRVGLSSTFSGSLFTGFSFPLSSAAFRPPPKSSKPSPAAQTATPPLLRSAEFHDTRKNIASFFDFACGIFLVANKYHTVCR